MTCPVLQARLMMMMMKKMNNSEAGFGQGTGVILGVH